MDESPSVGAKRSSGWAVLVALLLLLGLTAGAAWLVWLAFQNFPTRTAATLVGAAATPMLALVGLSLGNYLAKQREIELEVRRQKIPVYEEFMRFWFRILSNDDDPKPTQEEQRQFFRSFTEKIIIWGSDDFVAKWAAYRRSYNAQDDSQKSDSSLGQMLQFEQLLYTIRRDVGHRNTKLKPGDVLVLFINDIDSYLPAASGKRR